MDIELSVGESDMRPTVVASATIISTALILLTECSEQTSSPQADSPATDAPLYDAPHIDHDLFLRHPIEPCSVVTDQQRGQLNVTAPGIPQQNNFEPGCRWQDANGPSKADITVTFKDPQSFEGLSFIYSARGDYSYFKTYPSIEGYPGVAAADQIPGQCDVYVGLSDERAIDIRVELGRGQEKPADHTDPCNRALTVAHDVVKTLKSNQ